MCFRETHMQAALVSCPLPGSLRCLAGFLSAQLPAKRLLLETNHATLAIPEVYDLHGEVIVPADKARHSVAPILMKRVSSWDLKHYSE